MNKVEKIKAGIERLKKSLPWGSCASQLSMECNCKNEAYNEVLSFIDSLPDTEKDFGIKESVISFGASDSELMEATYFIPQGYHAAIEGNKVIIKKGEDPVSNDLEEAAMRYAKSKHKDTTLQQIVSWDFKAGAQWQKEHMIEKACEWLSDVSIEDMTYKYNNFDTSEGWYKFIEDFKKVIEE